MADLKSFAEMLVNQTQKDVEKLAQILKDEYGIEPASKENFARMVQRTYSKKEKNDLRISLKNKKKKS